MYKKFLSTILISSLLLTSCNKKRVADDSNSKSTSETPKIINENTPLEIAQKQLLEAQNAAKIAIEEAKKNASKETVDAINQYQDKLTRSEDTIRLKMQEIATLKVKMEKILNDYTQSKNISEKEAETYKKEIQLLDSKFKNLEKAYGAMIIQTENNYTVIIADIRNEISRINDDIKTSYISKSTYDQKSNEYIQTLVKLNIDLNNTTSHKFIDITN